MHSRANTRSSTGVVSRPSGGAQPRQSLSVPLPAPTDAQFEDKELEEIRRYEDFTTIGRVLCVHECVFCHLKSC